MSSTAIRTAKYYKISKYLNKTILHVILGITSLIFIFPFIWMILSSFMTNSEITSYPFTFFPGSFYLGNYKLVFEDIALLLRAFLNSFIVSSIVTFSVAFTSSSAGFMFAKMKFKGNAMLFAFVLSSLLFPYHVVLIPLYIIASKLHLLDSYIGIAFPFMISGFGIFLLRQFIYGIPDSLIDSARMDGASNFKIYLKIIIPLTKSILSIISILFFVWSYDEFMWPLIAINSDEMKTIPIMIGRFTKTQGQMHGASMAAVTLVTIPILIVYLFFQKNFVKGMSMSGLKY
jgi:ABC-type glycerol-3-phosphate transport system permease component